MVFLADVWKINVAEPIIGVKVEQEGAVADRYVFGHGFYWRAIVAKGDDLSYDRRYFFTAVLN